ncbi:MAG: O-antigen ligase family protein [Alphaproteobacteria bacterium]|nr:O-antigen ligase family protein [Alphaproteobacteria bacterium]
MKAALAEKSGWGRAAHVFWLLGPFILLIERSPADLWLSLLALVFLGRSVARKDFSWLKVFWVRAVLVFWAVTLVSALASADPSYALGEALIWIRFPLFAMATVFWLAQDKRLLYAMLISTGLGMVAMCGILTAELIIVGQQHGRLSWPYGDLVPGNYLAKVGLPAFSIMVALAVSVRGRLAALLGTVGLATMVLSIMTGERVNFIIRACGGMLAGLVWRPKLGRYIILVLIEVAAVVLLFKSKPDVAERFIGTFIEHLPTGSHSPYYNTMKPGFLAFDSAPVLGIGTGNFRNMCADLVAGQPLLECHPHPHNFYIQLLGENGIIGLIAGTVMMWSIIATCFIAGRRNKANVVAATAFVVPLGLFWPIASTADFFGQWNNIFMWSALALALAATTLKSDRN